jgi:hypothetical protein
VARLACALITTSALLIPVNAAGQPGNHYPPGCLRQADVNIGYYPHRLLEPSALLIAPDPHAPRIRMLRDIDRFAVQSVQNPDRVADPGQAAPVNGYAWGYAKKGGRSGWVAASALAPDDGDWADGPAHHDYQAGGVGVPQLRRAPRFTVGHPVSGTVRIAVNTAYLRWAPRGPARALIVEGEAVIVLWRSSGHYCVQTGDGLRGWVHVDTTDTQ